MSARSGVLALSGVLASVVIFTAGILVGMSLEDGWPALSGTRTGAASDAPPDAVQTAVLPTIVPSESISARETLLDHLRERRFEAAVVWLESLEDTTDTGTHLELRATAMAVMGQWLAAGRRDEAWGFVRAYLDSYPRDHAALFHAADLAQMEGDWLTALDYLFRVLEYPESPAVAQTTRRRIDVLVRSHATTLAQAGEFEALVDFYERLIGFDPGQDDYRLAVAQWLLELGHTERAEAWLEETAAGNGRRDRLLARSRLSAAGIAVERDGQRLLTTARVGSHAVRLLVDTGATMTSLSPALLRRIGARPEGPEIEVATASGRVSAQVYRVDHLEIGPLRLDGHPVIGLELPTPGIDGLLGMDILRQTGLPPLNSAVETP